MTVVVITETHRGVMDTAHATVADYRDLAVEWDGANLKLDHRV